MAKKSILLIGGARSGKSKFALELARQIGEPVLFVATATAGDEEMKQRIEEHLKLRPATWQTLEVTSRVGNQIALQIGGARVVIIDCITLLLNNLFSQHSDAAGERMEIDAINEELDTEIRELVDCMSNNDASFIIVTNDVGLGLVPENRMGRQYRDLLGQANQLLAAQVSEVYLMVAGIPLRIKGTD